MTARSVYALLSVLFCAVMAIPAHAQYTISGKIQDTGGHFIENAIVIGGSNTDSNIFKTAVTDKDGFYSITLSVVNGTFIRVNAAGFVEQVKLLGQVSTHDTTINFTLLTKDNLLDVVTVSSRKPLVERKPDRTIFNVSASIASIGGNAIDAMKKAPGLLVKESDNSFSLVGKSGVRVMVNGRILELSGEDLVAYLQAIPADNIDRIEVITTPPAQYDAAGNTGLVNVVLKKNRKAGFNGNVRIGYEQSGYGTGITGAAMNYRKGGLNMYSDVSYAAGSKANAERLSSYYPGQVYRLEDLYRKQTDNLQYTIGADYELHKKSVLGILFNNSDFHRSDVPNTNIYVVNLSASALDSVIRTRGNSFTTRQNKNLNLNYTYTIDTTGKKITINANRLWFGSDRNRTYETINYDGQSLSPTGISAKNKNMGEQAIVITAAQADAELPYKWAALSLGGKLSLSENKSDNNFFYFSNGAYYNDPAVSNTFNYKEKVEAIYISAQKSAGKWSFQGGLRGEATQAEGYSLGLKQANTNSYFNLFPTAYMVYKPVDAHEFNINYSKRINRPGYRSLDPFRLYTSAYSYTEGNPFLKPSYSHNVEASYTYKSKYILSAYYQSEQQHFGQLFFADTANKGTYVTWANMGSFIGYGMSVNVSWAPAEWWEMQAVASGGVQEINTTNGGHSYSLPTGYFSVNNSFVLNNAKTILAEANVFYLSKYQQDFFYFHGISSVDTGFKALLLDKKLAISLNATDIFATQRSRGANQVTGQTLDSYFDTRNVRLMLNYKFGRDKEKAARQRATGIEDEKGRT